MNRVGIIAKRHTSGISEILQKLHKWLSDRRIEILFDKRTGTLLDFPVTIQPKSKIPSLVDLIIVLGGDGTLLSAARVIGTHDVPILGVNLGSLGFLTEITLNEMYDSLEHVLRNEYSTMPRLLLTASLSREEELLAEYWALNDVVMNKSALARIIDLHTSINGQGVTTYKADGLIVATPTGSTAYNLSAGGPIIHPDMHALIMTPICPHTLTNRPIVVPDDSEIRIVLESKNEDVFLTLDGQVGLTLRYRDEIRIRKADTIIRLVSSMKRNYFEVLRTKLKWGER
ncbi:NAD(+) kinase [candidate division KSB3 bacterium]|uniref:NAD kinase n=1 Tax=candidate division KSB3 bacterium TaxID=2044937 RepID=A0A2G6E7X2_9BACT|nr:MAG: NAD(+) kinase [candidate division KSB3 bacterium]PIE30381.1 MAG: NAD(+) kinase [candidate division KSB3 bacterium]